MVKPRRKNLQCYLDFCAFSTFSQWTNGKTQQRTKRSISPLNPRGPACHCGISQVPKVTLACRSFAATTLVEIFAPRDVETWTRMIGWDSEFFFTLFRQQVSSQRTHEESAILQAANECVRNSWDPLCLQSPLPIFCCIPAAAALATPEPFRHVWACSGWHVGICNRQTCICPQNSGSTQHSGQPCPEKAPRGLKAVGQNNFPKLIAIQSGHVHLLDLVPGMHLCFHIWRRWIVSIGKPSMCGKLMQLYQSSQSSLECQSLHISNLLRIKIVNARACWLSDVRGRDLEAAQVHPQPQWDLAVSSPTALSRAKLFHPVRHGPSRSVLSLFLGSFFSGDVFALVFLFPHPFGLRTSLIFKPRRVYLSKWDWIFLRWAHHHFRTVQNLLDNLDMSGWLPSDYPIQDTCIMK